MQKYHKNRLLCGSNLTILLYYFMEDDNFCIFYGPPCSVRDSDMMHVLILVFYATLMHVLILVFHFIDIHSHK